MLSQTLRAILREQYNVDVGLYSYGPCLKPGLLPPGTRIGRYCSIAAEVQFLRRNHPKDFISLHPFFYNRGLGLLDTDPIPPVSANPVEVGHDVWIGYRSIVLPGCRRIGNGAIIGASAVVTKDVPDFAIVAGNPAKKIGERFPPEIAAVAAESRWWDRPIEELVGRMDLFTAPVGAVTFNHIGASADTSVF